MLKKTIVVCGATGMQGGGVIRAFRDSDQFELIALSRSPDGPKARALAAQGLEIRRADLEDADSLVAAFEGAYGVFGVTQPWSPDYKTCDGEAEVRQGKFIADACVANDVEHLVYSSVFGANGREELAVMAHLSSKFEVEDYIESRGIPRTIVCPAAIMDMIGTTDFMPVKAKMAAGIVGKDVRMPFVHTDDIGAMVRLAFERRDEYLGKQLPAISDFFTGTELATIAGEITGNPRYRFRGTPTWLFWMLSKAGVAPEEFYLMHVLYTRWGTAPYPPAIEAALAEARRLNPRLVDIRTYLERLLAAPDVARAA